VKRGERKREEERVQCGLIEGKGGAAFIKEKGAKEQGKEEGKGGGEAFRPCRRKKEEKRSKEGERRKELFGIQ